MKYRISEAALRYRTEYLSDKMTLKNKSCFYLTDYEEIYKKMIEQKFSANSIYNAIITALEAGFMIGYETALKDIKKGDNRND